MVFSIRTIYEESEYIQIYLINYYALQYA